MALVGELFLLAVGIILLIKGSDLFVDAGSAIGKVLKISEILLGITIVALGTSLPEFVVVITSAQGNSNEIALGNILGTNIFNTCVILSIIALIRPVKFKRDTIRKDMHMSVVTALVLCFLMADKLLTGADVNVNVITRADGLILLVLLAIFMYYSLLWLCGLLERAKRKNW